MSAAAENCRPRVNDAQAKTKAKKNEGLSDFIQLTTREYESIRDLVYSRFGIHLTEQKKSLIVGRLQKELRRLRFKSFTQYYDHVIHDKSGEALTTLVNRISTNHTFFYREADHFTYFVEQVLPEIKAGFEARREKSVRLWCAGCSSGEEPYTLAMLLHQFFRMEIGALDIRVLATDISDRVLQIAKAGLYPGENVLKLPEALRRKYMAQTSNGEWEVEPQIRKLVHFGRFNLMRPQFPFKGTFDAIFCRNVMIYFDNPTKKTLVQKFYNFTRTPGYLFIGHSETLNRKESPYTYIRPAVYRKEEAT